MIRPRIPACWLALAVVLGCAAPRAAHANIVRRDRDSTRVAVPPPAADTTPYFLPGPDTLLGGSALDLDTWNGLHPRKGPGLTPRRGLSPVFDYNRVDQLRLGAGARTVTREPFAPRLQLELARSMGRSLWTYDFSAEQPLSTGPYIALGGSFYRITDSNDGALVSHAENILSAMLFRQDYLDYFGRRGARAYAHAEWSESSLLEVGFRVDRITSLATVPSSWSLLAASRDFRPNPSVPEGNLHQFDVAFERSRRGGRSRRPGLDILAGYDAAGGRLGGDFDFSRARGEYRWTFKLSPGVWVQQRFAAGARLSGELPREFEYYAGGIGTLRAHEYKQYQGDRYYLFNVEYAANLGQHVPAFDRNESLRGLELVLFLDSGKAWDSHGTGASPASPAWDAGVGLQTQGDGFHLYLAQDLRAADAGPKLTFRLGRSF